MADQMPVVVPPTRRRNEKRVSVPMEVFRPHEEQAKENHGGQSLDRLAERHGISSGEAAAILQDEPWGEYEDGEYAWAIVLVHTIDALEEDDDG